MLPNDSGPQELPILVDALDNAIGQWPLEHRADESPNVLDGFAGALRCRLDARLQVLYEPVQGGPESQAIALGIELPLDALVNRFLEALTVALAQNLPSSDSRCRLVLDELRQAQGHQADMARSIQARYLVCCSYETLVEMSSGNLRNVPGENKLLVPTPVLRTWKLLAQEQGSMRRPQAWGGTARDKHDYLEQYPNAEDNERSGGSYPTFETRRPATQEDLDAYVLPLDPLSRSLSASGVQSSDIAEVLGYYEHCGPRDPNSSYQEMLHLREVWGMLLQVTAMEDGVVLHGVEGVTYDAAPLSHNTRSTRQDGFIPPGRLAEAPLHRGESVLIPIGTLLPPIGYDPIAIFWSHTDIDAPSEWGTKVSGVQLAEDVDTISLLGSRSYPTTVRITHRGQAAKVPVHPFEPGRVYLVSTAWFIGSCPQLFKLDGGGISYIGPLFGETPGRMQSCQYLLPEFFAGSILVAEIEDEVTHIATISQGDDLLIENVTLETGHGLVLTPRWNGEPITFYGSYSPRSKRLVDGGALERNGRVVRFMALAMRSLACPSTKGLVELEIW